jgi:hypothetical protein
MASRAFGFGRESVPAGAFMRSESTQASGQCGKKNLDYQPLRFGAGEDKTESIQCRHVVKTRLAAVRTFVTVAALC